MPARLTHTVGLEPRNSSGRLAEVRGSSGSRRRARPTFGTRVDAGRGLGDREGVVGLPAVRVLGNRPLHRRNRKPRPARPKVAEADHLIRFGAHVQPADRRQRGRRSPRHSRTHTAHARPLPACSESRRSRPARPRWPGSNSPKHDPGRGGAGTQPAPDLSREGSAQGPRRRSTPSVTTGISQSQSTPACNIHTTARASTAP